MKTSVVNIYSHFLSMHISRVCHASLSKIEILLKPTFRKLESINFQRVVMFSVLNVVFCMKLIDWL